MDSVVLPLLLNFLERVTKLHNVIITGGVGKAVQMRGTQIEKLSPKLLWVKEEKQALTKNM